MLRRSVLLSFAVGAMLTAAVPLAGTGGGDPVPDETVVVGEAIYAPTAFERRAGVKAASAARPACQDSTYAHDAWRLPSTFSWHYNPKGAPATVASTALVAVRNATWTLFHAGYTCGSTTNLGITDRYLGSSTRTAQVSPTGTCTGNDNVSVVSWGALPPGVLAYTCVYYKTRSGTVVASDTLIDNVRHTWFTTRPASCANQFDLQSVLVHERGHAAGLSHVDQRSHGAQTMSGKTPACDTSRRTLGLGDVAGLKAKYLG